MTDNDDPAINDNGELASVDALANLFYKHDMHIMKDTVNGNFWINRGRAIEAATAVAFIRLAKDAGRIQAGINPTTLIRRYKKK